MARFDIYQTVQSGRQTYVLDVQANYLSALPTRIVAPLVLLPRTDFPIKDLNPIFEIDNRKYVMLTQDLVSLPSRFLKRTIQSAADRHADIMRALDILLTGF